jgi:hypothetical protein
MGEVNIQPVDCRHKLRQGVQLRLDRPPIVVRLPVVDERLDLLQLHTLGLIRDRLAVRPAGGGDAPTKVDQCLFGNVDAEGADFSTRARRREFVRSALRHELCLLLNWARTKCTRETKVACGRSGCRPTKVESCGLVYRSSLGNCC